MRRATLAGLALGLAAGLLFVHHDVLRLTVAWPVVLGFALWGAVGREGARGLNVAVAAAAGAALAYLSYAIVAEFLPITGLWLGLVVGVAIGLMVLIGLVVAAWLSLSAMLVGFAAFAGIFEPLWQESPGALRTDGIETLTVAILALLIGILGSTVVRAMADRVEPAAAEEGEARAADAQPTRDAVGGRAS